MGLNEKTLKIIEKRIRFKMHAIQKKTVTPKDAKIGFLLNSLKTQDEVLYDELMTEYKKILKEIL